MDNTLSVSNVSHTLPASSLSLSSAALSSVVISTSLSSSSSSSTSSSSSSSFSSVHPTSAAVGAYIHSSTSSLHSLTEPEVPSVGTTVIVSETPGKYLPVTLTLNGEIQNHYGIFQHKDIIGVPYGRKIFSRHHPKNTKNNNTNNNNSSTGFIMVLKLTPEYWTLALPHRTQILYTIDIGMVVQQLYLRPGYRVIESGTGSGSLTHSLARAVGTTGHVYTFEFNLNRAQAAQEEFNAHGIGSIVTVTHRDVVGEGFALLPDCTERSIDSIFLDLPNPWEALPRAYSMLKVNGRICSYSPCMEQVQRTCEMLTKLGFDDVRTFETLGNYMDVIQTSHTETNTGIKLFQPFVPQNDDVSTSSNNYPSTNKKSKTDSSHVIIPSTSSSSSSSATFPSSTSSSMQKNSRGSVSKETWPLPWPSDILTPPENVTLRPAAESRGHTAYLTFASVYQIMKE